jgi:Eukaryotic protein of unknown function (DUF953)
MVDGVSGCPGCVAAEPAINAAMEKIAESSPVVFVECPVARSEYKGNPAYPYRTHALLKIPEVPTLFRWGKTKAVGRLAGAELLTSDAILDTLAHDLV